MLTLTLLFWTLQLVRGIRTDAEDSTYQDRHTHDEVSMTTRPHIYYCRSPNMEDFTCWWHPLDNLTDGQEVDEQEVSYVLTYSKDKGPKLLCPDYVSAGPNSCHFDRSHTSIWKIYCMNVTAVTAHRNYTSNEHCLDVAEIVQTEAPVNLTYLLSDAGGDEMGHNALLSWAYPVPSDLQYGWITLVYELQYRRVNEPDNWKVKHPVREPHVELLGLPVGDYVVRVRCRSHNYGLWSKWSSTLLMSIPVRPPTGKVLVLILVTGVGVVALLAIAFGIFQQSKRIKEYFLPPIPKPRIIGIDPLLLKKGNLDEINRHFSDFHGYRPPVYAEELWDQVSADHLYLSTLDECAMACSPADTEKDALIVPCDLSPLAARRHLAATNPTPYVQSPSPYGPPPSRSFAPVASTWPRPEIVSLPGTDYSMMGRPGITTTPPDAAAMPANHSPHDFYTCVQLMNDSGEVHLVPCLPPAYCRELAPPFYHRNEKEEKKRQLAEYKNNQRNSVETERSEAAVPLLPEDRN
ncbi:growth hormone receptor isoform X2 [Sphaeramia orbicularis]|uniref:growth hormone receptor isoform X2 n=1 Tax=Sphaeramia orbicularis TaxID=375764 RepID=UPI0011805197|nr:growth hormone receptor-like isoform X2 [Sphaeramia orbicularis]